MMSRIKKQGIEYKAGEVQHVIHRDLQVQNKQLPILRLLR